MGLADNPWADSNLNHSKSFWENALSYQRYPIELRCATWEIYLIRDPSLKLPETKILIWSMTGYQARNLGEVAMCAPPLFSKINVRGEGAVFRIPA